MATVYMTASSLDGYIADPAHSLSWLFATPNHERDPDGGYDGPDLDPESFMAGVGAAVMGASTWAWLLRHDPGTARGGMFGPAGWVVTHAELDLPGGMRRFSGDVRELHPQLLEVAGDKDVWIIGGGDLAGQFADAGLLDRVIVHSTPVVLGAGAPLLPRRLRLWRDGLARDGQFVYQSFRVVGPEPPDTSDG